MSNTRKNDGYRGKVAFWTEQLELAQKGEGRYSLERCEESLAYFKEKAAKAASPGAVNYGHGMVRISLADGFLSVHHGQDNTLLHYAYTGERGQAEVRVRIQGDRIHVTRKNCGVIKSNLNPQLWEFMWKDIRSGKTYQETISNLLTA